METISLSKNSVRIVAALSLLFLFPLMASAQSVSDTDVSRIRVTAQECRNFLSSGAFSLQQMSDHREWRRKNTPQRMWLKAWLSAHDTFLAAQKEAQVLHTQKIIACHKYRGELDVVTTRPTRIIVINPSSSYFFPGRLVQTGGGNDSNEIIRVPQSLGITRPSVRNIANFYSVVTDHPTKRTIQLDANAAEMNRRFLR